MTDKTLFLVLAMFMTQIFFIKKTNSFLFTITIFLFIAVLAYLTLWFGTLSGKHDYYLTNLLIFLVFVLISFFTFLKDKFQELFNSKWLRITFCLILSYNVYLASAKTAVKHFTSIPREKYPVCYTEEEVDFMEWLKFDFNYNKRPLRDIAGLLDSIGIKRSEHVISIPDASFNISLYFLDRKGWTDFDSQEPRSIDWFNDKMKKGVNYLIINNPDVFNDPAVVPYTRNRIYKSGHTSIYEISNRFKEQKSKKHMILKQTTNTETLKR